MSIDHSLIAPAADQELRVPSVRLTPEGDLISSRLGLLADLEGSWRGEGFNLVARPDKEGNSPLYLELNQTEETLKFDAIGASIPNRGFAMNDIELYGLTYLQKISDAVTKGALHIEPGIWVTQPNTSAPPDSAPDGQQLISRMGSIPHGNAILAQGIAKKFTGSPTLKLGGDEYNGSVFPSFNSTPFPVNAPIFAAGTAMFDVPVPPPGPAHGFTPYTLSNAPSTTNPRTPFGNVPPVALPPEILNVPMQDVVNDPIRLLQAVIDEQIRQGYTFEGTVLNISSAAKVTFSTVANAATPTVSISATAKDGGIENIDFLETNATSALVYATFWIEKLSHPSRRDTFFQLQYAQMVLLNFPILGAPAAAPPLSWPHVSVGTLTKDFN